MAFTFSDLSSVSDQALASAIAQLVAQERQATAALVAALAEFDARRLYLPAGCSSLFTYCTQVLHLAEHAAYNRIEAARVARRFPALVERLASGELTLTAVRLLAPHLTESNHRELFDRARHKSKRDLEEVVAALRPQPDASPVVRKLPSTPSPSRAESPNEGPAPLLEERPRLTVECVEPRTVIGSHKAAPIVGAGAVERRTPTHPAIVAPLAPERYKVQFTISREVYDKLRRTQDLLRHLVPDGDPAEIFDRALSLLLKDLERRKCASAAHPRPPRKDARPRSLDRRHIPAAVRREVWARDEGRCAFVGTAGRCSERGLLEFHHIVPFADRGSSTLTNLELRCRRHNQYEAERWFGDGVAVETSGGSGSEALTAGTHGRNEPAAALRYVR